MFTEDFEFTANFSADGMIHAVQPMTLTPRGSQRAIHHTDSSDDPMVCLTCPFEDCTGSARCYKRRKKLLEENTNVRNQG